MAEKSAVKVGVLGKESCMKKHQEKLGVEWRKVRVNEARKSG